jgi:S-adenosylmethionine:tRNA ribosyltransferase-isomerase
MAPARVIDDFELAAELEASEPPEARGLARDEVRLLVSDLERDTISHAQFRDLPAWLAPGYLVVVNTSATMSAAVAAISRSGDSYDLHFSTVLPGGFWTVELRHPDAIASVQSDDGVPGLFLHLPGGASATLLAPYPLNPRGGARSRLWLAEVRLSAAPEEYLARNGFPIRYRYVPEPWPLAMYQTVFAREPGSAEMPSAARPFTTELVTRLVAAGVQFAPILLHTGVASLEDHEPPYEERYRVSAETASRVTAARRAGRRIVAVGTTVVRALETVTDNRGVTHPGEGWTSLIVDASRPLRSVNSLITGLHEPRATHLAMLERVVDAAVRSSSAQVSETLCGRCHLERAYAVARREGYLWHEFGDSHVILGAPMTPR